MKIHTKDSEVKMYTMKANEIKCGNCGYEFKCEFVHTNCNTFTNAKVISLN